MLFILLYKLEEILLPKEKCKIPNKRATVLFSYALPSYLTIVLLPTELYLSLIFLKLSAPHNHYYYLLVGKGVEMCFPHIVEI